MKIETAYYVILSSLVFLLPLRIVILNTKLGENKKFMKIYNSTLVIFVIIVFVGLSYKVLPIL